MKCTFTYKTSLKPENKGEVLPAELKQPQKFATVKQIPKIYPGAFSESSIRWLIFNEKENGFSRCVRRIGKRVLINLDEFEAWIEGQQGIKALCSTK